MKRLMVSIGVAGLALLSSQAAAQTPASPDASAVVLQMVTSVEQALMGVAEEMPEDKDEFVPTNGAFRGVRTFSRQIKHAAAVQRSNTRLGLVGLAVSHSWNHYEQVVPYLRMNGLTPPRTP